MYTLQLGKTYTNHNSFSPSGPSPHNLAQGFDAPPTLERSGSEHRRAVTSSRP